MGSKTPPANKPARVPQPDGTGGGLGTAPDGGTVSLRLQRVADALQVPASVLYDLPNAVGQASAPGTGPGARSDDPEGGDLEGECVALLCAYRCIPDPDERRRLLVLAQSLADRA